MNRFRVVFVGPEGSVFPVEAAKKLQSRNIDTKIVSWSPLPVNLGVFEKIIRHIEWRLSSLWERNFLDKTCLDSPVGWRFVDNIFRARGLASQVMSHKPDIVIAHEAHTSGLCLRHCGDVIKAVQVWGGDIYWYCESSPVQSYLVKKVLNDADVILTSSKASVGRMQNRFSVSPKKIVVVSSDIQFDEFSPLVGTVRLDEKLRYGVSSDQIVIANCRRFQKQWGGEVFLHSALKLAGRYGNVKFFIVTGVDGDQSDFYSRSRNLIRESGYEDRFIFVDKKLTLKEWKNIMAVSDIFVSAMGEGDLLSASVLQAAACGGIPVLTDLPQFLDMAESDFSCYLAKAGNSDDFAVAIERAITELPNREAIYLNNRTWLSSKVNNADYAQQIIDLVDSFSTRSRGV